MPVILYLLESMNNVCVFVCVCYCVGMSVVVMVCVAVATFLREHDLMT